MARIMSRSQILPEMIEELHNMEDTRDAFINMSQKSKESPRQIAQYRQCVSQCVEKIKIIKTKIKAMNEFIAHQSHQLNQERE